MRVGDIVHITFMDHCTNVTGSTYQDQLPYLVEVFGRVVRVDRQSVTVSHWDILTDNFERRQTNWETSTIIRSTITKVAVWP